MEDTTIVGVWSSFTADINEQAMNACNEATAPLLGIHYTPVKVSQQVVEGTNYRFLCNAEETTPERLAYPVIIQISAPLPGKGEPHVTRIIPL